MGLFRVWGLGLGSMGIMEKKMETATGYGVQGFGFRAGIKEWQRKWKRL